MFGFIKKLFGFGGCKADSSCCEAEAPYKIEAAVAKVADVNNDGKVNLEDAKAAVNKVATTVAKKTAPKKQGGPKPAGKKPAAKKPAQPKQGGQKPRSRKPKAKPAAPQQ